MTILVVFDGLLKSDFWKKKNKIHETLNKMIILCGDDSYNDIE